MSWHHPDPYFFLSLLAILAAVLAVIYEICEGIRKFLRRNTPKVQPIRSTVNKTTVGSFAQLQRVAREARAEASPSSRDYLKTAKPLDGLLRDRPWPTGQSAEHEFNKVFMTTSNEGKEALIKRWMARQKCGRLEAMRLAIEEWRRENR